MAAEPLPAGVSRSIFDRLVAALVEFLFSSGSPFFGRPDNSSDGVSFRSRAYTDAREWATARAGELIRGLSATDQEFLASSISQAIEKGWTKAELVDYIENESWSAARIDMIARTESAFAMNAGKLIADRAVGVKYWVVMDSPGCLPKGHAKESVAPDVQLGVVDGSADADGQIWTYEQCMAYLIGHPHCERAFRQATKAEIETLKLAA